MKSFNFWLVMVSCVLVGGALWSSAIQGIEAHEKGMKDKKEELVEVLEDGGSTTRVLSAYNYHANHYVKHHSLLQSWFLKHVKNYPDAYEIRIVDGEMEKEKIGL